MRLRKATLFLSLLFVGSLAVSPFAAAFDSFQGKVISDGINVRTDSTTNSKIACTLNRGDFIDVVGELYDWYKIALPVSCPSFIRKDFVLLSDDKNGKVLNDNVNIRLAPTESSPIVGRAQKDEIVNVLEQSGNWYKIRPFNHCYAWVNKKFVEKTTEAKKNFNVVAPIVTPVVQAGEEAVFVGSIEPYGKVIKRQATHKLVCADRVYLLKGDPAKINSFLYHIVKVTGKIISSKQDKFPIIEISKMEILN